ncbi:hypothetical protein A4A49_11146 [Nicotiana attenuata]|uniref:RNase H type-1 domain-containing protein n=1 Tax=Nicotiana attenuata TaxID=49451 RepID=A0A314L1H6_NICAT|nr:hypothetical protein A4A49_11146 [Nicotiana attenuata]
MYLTPLRGSRMEENRRFHLYIDRGYKDVMIESDSQILINAINGQSFIPWQINQLVKQIVHLKNIGNYSFSDYYREANGPADLLANWGLYEKTSTFFTDANALP